MNAAIIVAIVALVSTIVGATIGAATNYVLAVRRERADERRDSRDLGGVLRDIPISDART